MVRNQTIFAELETWGQWHGIGELRAIGLEPRASVSTGTRNDPRDSVVFATTQRVARNLTVLDRGTTEQRVAAEVLRTWYAVGAPDRNQALASAIAEHLKQPVASLIERSEYEYALIIPLTTQPASQTTSFKAEPFGS